MKEIVARALIRSNYSRPYPKAYSELFAVVDRLE